MVVNAQNGNIWEQSGVATDISNTQKMPFCYVSVVTFFLCGTFSFGGSSPSGKPLFPVVVLQ